MSNNQMLKDNLKNAKALIREQNQLITKLNEQLRESHKDRAFIQIAYDEMKFYTRKKYKKHITAACMLSF